MIRRPPRSTLSSSSAASDVYKRQLYPGTSTEFDRRAVLGADQTAEQWCRNRYRAVGAYGRWHLDQREEPRLPVPCRPVPGAGDTSVGPIVLRGTGRCGPLLWGPPVARPLGRHLGGGLLLQFGGRAGLCLAA